MIGSRPRWAWGIAAVSVLAVSLLGVSACSSSGGSSSPSPASSEALTGQTWRATEIAGTAALAGETATDVIAVFDAGKISGSGGVNSYSGSYTTTDPDGISFSQVASTMMAGPPQAMAQEKAYFDALAKAARYAVSAGSLTLLDDQGAALVRFETVQPTALEGTEWQALAYNNGKDALVGVTAEGDITAVFGADGTLAGSASVNQYSTTYTTSGKTMSIDGAVVTTKMAGPEDLMRQEAAYLAALPKTATFSVEGDELWLRDASGAALAHYVAR